MLQDCCEAVFGEYFACIFDTLLACLCQLSGNLGALCSDRLLFSQATLWTRFCYLYGREVKTYGGFFCVSARDTRVRGAKQNNFANPNRTPGSVSEILAGLRSPGPSRTPGMLGSPRLGAAGQSQVHVHCAPHDLQARQAMCSWQASLRQECTDPASRAPGHDLSHVHDKQHSGAKASAMT